MWNGWEMFGFAVAFVIVHSSTVLRDTCWALSSPLNFLPLIVCCASGAVEAKLIVREPFTSESAISSRNLGGLGAGEMNCDCWPVTGCWPALMRTHISAPGQALLRSEGSASCCATTGNSAAGVVGACTSRSTRLPEAIVNGWFWLD